MSNSVPTTKPNSCDIVMKGGITSGVVYPSAIVELAKVFQLRNIGGTSAGAIAAAAAAAAQLGDIKKAEQGGFKLLAGLPEFLSGKNPTKRTNLFTFFQPQPKTRALYITFSSALGAPSTVSAIFRVLGNAVRFFPAAPLSAIALGALLCWAEDRWWLAVGWLIIGIFFALLLLIWRVLYEFGSCVPGAEGNLFGLCSGMSSSGGDDKVAGPSTPGMALTVWLSKYLNELAGLDPDGPPLTFGNLWYPDLAPEQNPAKDAKPALQLEMFTTCLSKGRPYRLPFADDGNSHENSFYFQKQEFLKLFPENVVDWLVKHPRQSGLNQAARDHDFFPLPDPRNLPVVVATRLSLSFPVLLSAVPLRAYDDAKGDRKTADPERCWFSDGGISSNFPIHLFDSPIPRSPTFGINLVELPQTTPDDALKIPKMVSNNHESLPVPWNRFDTGKGLQSVFGFIGSIFGTMQNWSDNTLSEMPGCRDRIAQVGLRPTEGGMNLDMPEETIKALSDRGTNAAIELVARFNDHNTQKGIMNWPNHRWLRFRSMLASLEEMITNIDAACALPQAGDVAYPKWISEMPINEAPSFQWADASQRDLALKTLVALREIAKDWKDAPRPASEGAPRPRPELLPRPRI